MKGIIFLLPSATNERLMKQRLLRRTVLAALMTVVAVLAYSQGPPPPPPPPAPPSSVPIDGGVFLLLGAGLVYGSRKLYKEL